MKLGGEIGYRLLSRIISVRLPNGQPVIKPPPGACDDRQIEACQRQLAETLADDFVALSGDKRVVDFGCGRGVQAVALAEAGAVEVIGIDINEEYLVSAKETAALRDQSSRCRFLHPQEDRDEVEAIKGTVDVIFAIDSFEHIVDAAAVLAEMYELLKPGGTVTVWFGPVWKHPRGLHLNYLRPLPWTHLLFSEEAIMRVRDEYRQDGMRRFRDINLSEMTAGKFRRLVNQSAFDVSRFEAIPIHGCRWLAALPGLGECFTSVVRCQLRKPGDVEVAATDDIDVCRIETETATIVG